MNSLDSIRNYINNERYSEAIDLIADIESHYFDSEEYWNLRGVACLHMNAYELSEDAFLKALEINPTNPDINYNLATVYQLIDCFSDAALYYGLCYRYTQDSDLKIEIENLFQEDNPCKSIFDCAYSTTRKSYIILSNIPWSDIQQRVHHISKSLSLLGNRVFFIQPKADIQIENHPDIKQLALSCSLEPTHNFNNLKVFKPLTVRDSATGEIQHDTYLELLETLGTHIINSNEEVTIIAYHPDFIDVLQNYKLPHKLIYDCVDDHSDNDMAYWGGKDCMLKEKMLMDKADYITTTSTSLFIERAVLQNRKNVFLSKNAVSERDFTILDNEVPSDLSHIPSPRIVYSGFVYNRFDEELFYNIVESNPDKSFVVIGPVASGLLEKEYPNLHFLGTKPHNELKYYLSNCDIGIVPHIEQCDMDIACDSIKQYEFLASGLDVITTFVPESTLDKINIYPASTAEEFNLCISKILKNRNNKEYSETKEFLALNSWNNRAALICNLTDSKITNNDFNYLLEKTRKTLSTANSNYSNPIISTLNIIAMSCSNHEKVYLLKNVYTNSKERFTEKYYLRLLLECKKYDDATEVISKSKWVDKELIDELVFLSNTENDLLKSFLIAIASDDFPSAYSLVRNIKPRDLSILYNAYINIKLGFNLDKKTTLSLTDLKLKNPIYKFVFNLLENDKNNNIFIIGDETASSRVMLQKIKETFQEADYLSLEDLNSSDKNIIFKKLSHTDTKIIVLSEANYVNIIRLLAENDIKECSIALILQNEVALTPVSENIMNSVKNKEYKRNIALIHLGAKDTNLHAIANLIPDKYKHKYNPTLLHLDSMRDKRSSVLLPLMFSITVSGHGSVYYHLPNYTYHFEVWHAGTSLKTCGLMDKQDKDSGIGDIKLFKRANAFCVASHMDMMLKNSWFALSEDKYRIIGQPRTDYLFSADGRRNLEKLINTNLKDKTIILNMPTFHSFDVTGRIEGAADLNESIKIRNFDYKKFNKYLVDNNMVFISKVHPREEDIVTRNMNSYKDALSNIFILSNDDLDNCNLSIYEILNGADILLTDYSSVYSDFLLLDRPVIFINTDLEEYREARGISLEPYDFWTAGPKVQSQDKLQEELLLSATNKDYFKEQRNMLLPIFHKYIDDKATERFWDLVDELS